MSMKDYDMQDMDLHRMNIAKWVHFVYMYAATPPASNGLTAQQQRQGDCDVIPTVRVPPTTTHQQSAARGRCKLHLLPGLLLQL